MEVKCNRFVVFLDIMGFKERVARSNADELYDELTTFNKDITRIIGAASNSEAEHIAMQEGDSEPVLLSNDGVENAILLAQFSDSIVLFSSDDTPNSLKSISQVASDIMMSAIHREKPIPLKGALAKGHITCDMSKQLFFGQALIDAYLLEENVQYYGIVVHHTAEAAIKELGDSLFRDAKIPLKSGLIEHYDIKLWGDRVAEVKEGLDRIRLTVSDSPRKYVDNTKSMLESKFDS